MDDASGSAAVRVTAIGLIDSALIDTEEVVVMIAHGPEDPNDNQKELAILAVHAAGLKKAPGVADGTAHVVFEPLDFMARLAALVPRPWLTRDAESSHLNLDREDTALESLLSHSITYRIAWVPGRGRRPSRCGACRARRCPSRRSPSWRSRPPRAAVQ